MDSGLRIVLIIVLFVGAAGAGGFLPQTVADAFLLAIGVAGMVVALLWGDAVGAAATVVRKMLTLADDRVNDLLFRQVREVLG